LEAFGNPEDYLWILILCEFHLDTDSFKALVEHFPERGEGPVRKEDVDVQEALLQYRKLVTNI
jgi:hypothetical protein